MSTKSICPGSIKSSKSSMLIEEQGGPCSPFRRDEGSWRWHKGKGQESQHLWNSPLGNQWLRQAEATPCLYTGPFWHCQQEGSNQKPGQPLSHWDQSTSPLACTKASGVATSLMGAAELGSTAGNNEGLMSWRREDGGRKLEGGWGRMLQAPSDTPNGCCADLVPTRR